MEEVLLDIEQCLNDRPLMCNEEDPDSPVLTPNTPVLGQGNAFPTEDDPANIDENVMRKRQKYIISCKEAVWKGGPKNISKHSERDVSLLRGIIKIVKNETWEL